MVESLHLAIIAILNSQRSDVSFVKAYMHYSSGFDVLLYDNKYLAYV